MANSKLHDDLVNEIEALESPEESVKALIGALADRIESAADNKVKLTDLKTVLRENPNAIASAVLANTPAVKVKTMTTSGLDAPSTAFAKQPSGVRQGMAGSSNDHRDQQFPENSNTEAERERIMREETARARGQNVVINTDMPDLPKADREAEEKAKADTEAKQRGEKVPA
jgi:hypothetical protein